MYARKEVGVITGSPSRALAAPVVDASSLCAAGPAPRMI
jgi:hypothetical protein